MTLLSPSKGKHHIIPSAYAPCKWDCCFEGWTIFAYILMAWLIIPIVIEWISANPPPIFLSLLHLTRTCGKVQAGLLHICHILWIFTCFCIACFYNTISEHFPTWREMGPWQMTPERAMEKLALSGGVTLTTWGMVQNCICSQKSNFCNEREKDVLLFYHHTIKDIEASFISELTYLSNDFAR